MNPTKRLSRLVSDRRPVFFPNAVLHSDDRAKGDITKKERIPWFGMHEEPDLVDP